MRIELICSGTELLRDEVNSNVNLIAERLSTLGFSLDQVTTVGDVASDLEAALRSSLQRSGAVFACGGLGPTFDDLTRECVSRVLRKPLVFSKPILKQISSRFASLRLSMPRENERQAFLIQNALPILNRAGTAPGQIIRSGKKILILLPGPPKELLPMMNSAVLPYLKKKYAALYSETLVLHLFGFPESEIDEIIAPVTGKNWNSTSVKVIFGILAHRSVIDVKTTVLAKSAPAGKSVLRKIRKALYEILGDKIYGENEETLESVAGDLLRKKKQSLSLAESCTGGLIASKITNVPGSSDYFQEGVVAYGNRAKMRLLGVRKETLRRHGVVSEETAREMALGALKRSGTDWALSVTGIAGPAGGSKEKPVGTVCFGAASKKGARTFTKKFFGDRSQIRERAALTALNLLRQAFSDP